MAKKIKFPLAMKNEVLVKDLNELRENFDLDKAVGYFLDGKLLRWLEARYYDTEADAIKNLNSDAPDFKQQLCNIFDVDFSAVGNIETDFDAVAEHNRKLTALKQYTSDPNLLAKVDSVAFNQEDLADLLDDGIHDIYLCNNSFAIPLRLENKRYIGIAKVEVFIDSDEKVDFESKHISFENIGTIKNKNFYQGGQEAENAKNYTTAFEYYKKAAKFGDNRAMFRISELYYRGHMGAVDYEKSFEWLKKSIENGNSDAYTFYRIGWHYHYGEGIFTDDDRTLKYYQKAVDLCSIDAMFALSKFYEKKENYVKAVHWLGKIMKFDQHRAQAMYSIGKIYRYGNNYYGKDINKAITWYEKAASLGNKAAVESLADIYNGSYVNEEFKDADKCIEWAEKAISLGSVNYCDRLVSYYDNDPVACNAKNLTKVVQDIEKIAVQGDKDAKRQAMLYLGHIYSVGGNGVAKNPEKALAWYEKAANLGYTDALDRLGRIYMKGDLVQENYFKAIEYFEKSLELEDSICFVGICDYFDDSDRSLEEFNKIVAQEEKSANLGNKWAMCRLAQLYQFGIENNTSFKMDRNITKAIEWYESAANLGSLAGFYDLSSIFSDNCFEQKNFKKAVKWLEKMFTDTSWDGYAAEKLGDIYMEGDDTLPKDVKKAIEWYEKSDDEWVFKKIDYLKILLE